MKKKLHFLVILGMFATALLYPPQVDASVSSYSDTGSFQQDPAISASNLKVYPNPVKNFKFSVSAAKGIHAIQVNNILGQETEVDFIKKGDTLFEVTLKERKQGIYLVTVIFEDQSKEVKRIIVNQE